MIRHAVTVAALSLFTLADGSGDGRVLSPSLRAMRPANTRCEAHDRKVWCPETSLAFPTVCLDRH